jgi:hypothetical protein
MKKPLIRDIDRWVAWKFPKTLHAERVGLTIACARLKREIGKELLPIAEWLNKMFKVNL